MVISLALYLLVRSGNEIVRLDVLAACRGICDNAGTGSGSLAWPANWLMKLFNWASNVSKVEYIRLHFC